MPNNNFNQTTPFLQSGDPTTENTPTLAYKGQLGIRFTVINPTRGSASASDPFTRPKTFQLVGTDSTMSVAPYKGAVAWWADKTKYQVTTSATKLGRGRIAGVFCTTITPGNFGCVQVGGPGTVKYVDSPTATPDATGKIVIPSATDGKADCLAANTAATYPQLGYSAGTVNVGDNTGPIDLDIPVTS